ncbi:MAG TPA: GtrA family protein [Solirubrobacteraceae bacterium]
MSTAVARPPLPALMVQLARYGLVGATNTALTLAAYAALVALGAPAPLAAAAGWSAGAVNGYVLNRGWTFASALRGMRPAARYTTVALLGAGLDAAGVVLLVGHEGLPRLAGEMAILPAVTALTFVLCRRWVFGRAMPA